MSMTTVILIVAVVAIIALVLLARDSGPKVTTIETKPVDNDDNETKGGA